MQRTRHILISLALVAVTGSLFAQPAQRSWSGTTARQFIHRYAEYIAQPREISTFAAYGSFLLGTGIMEHRTR